MRYFFFYALQVNGSVLLIRVKLENERESVHLQGYKHMQ